MKDLRKEYRLKALSEADISSDPFEQFGVWFDEALKASLVEPNAMMLATATAQGRPSVRAVLLKAWSKGGFVFFTNYQSLKGRNLAENPQAALLFYWNELERQIRIEGIVAKSSRAESAKYFASRPRAAQLAATVSAQSAPLESRAALEARYSQVDEQYRDKVVDCPAHWGGYVLNPSRFEFWQGRESRLHDRIEYRREQQTWALQRLQP